MCLLGRFPLILNQGLSVLLPPEGASFCQPCFSTCRLTEYSGAANTQDYRLCMAKDRGDFIASWALHICRKALKGLTKTSQAVVVYAFNPSTQEVSSRPA